MNTKISHPDNPDWSLEFIKVPTVTGTSSYKYVDICNTIYGTYIIVDEMPSHSTMITEFRIAYPNIKVIEILDIYVSPDQRNKGVGTGLLKMIHELYPEYAILLLVGASVKEYPQLDESEIPGIISNLLPFYEKNNYVNVNNIFGGYSNHVPMLYVGNDIGKNIATRFNEENPANTAEEIPIKEEIIEKKELSEKEKLIDYLNRTPSDATIENIIYGYITTYSEDFLLSRLVNLESMINKFINHRAIKCDYVISNVSEYATYVKNYLEGKMYTTKEAAEEHVYLQIKNIDKILELSKIALN